MHLVKLASEAMTWMRDTAVSRRRELRYAPELSPDVLHMLLLPLAGDVRTLCAAICVNKSWRAAVLHPVLWRKINSRRRMWQVEDQVLDTLDDARLAALVRRACGVDPDGVTQALVSLRVTDASVTLRGVLQALRGPRDDAGNPLLYGSLRTLRVAGLPFPRTEASKLVDALARFMRPPRPGRRPNLDVFGGITRCTKVLDVRRGGSIVCGRVASTLERSCDECSFLWLFVADAAN